MTRRHSATGGALLAVLLAGGMAPAHDDPLGQRYYECLTTATPPTIDGRLDDPCWKPAPTLGHFVVCIGVQGATARFQTRAWLLHDQDHLYVAVECLEPQMDKLVAQAQGDDAPLFSDDCVEVFVDVNHDHQTYFHFAVNANGARYEGRGYDASWSCDWKAAAGRGPRSWTVEMAIPLAAMGASAEAAVWGFNLNREHQAAGLGEYSGWSLVRGAFHRPEEFGHLVFGSLLPRLARAELPLVGRYAAWTLQAEAELTALRREASRLLAAEPSTSPWKPAWAALEEKVAALQKAYGQRERLKLEEWMDLSADLQTLVAGCRALIWDLKFHRLLADE